MSVPTRLEIIEKVKKDKRGVAAVFPIHYPRELFRAFGIHPIEVWGPPGVDTSLAMAHLQSYICSVVQSGLSFYLSGALDVVDIILVPHCCDSLQGLGSILKGFVKKDKPVFTLYIPRGKRNEDIEFLTKELKRLYENIAVFAGFKPTKDDLLDAVIKEEEADKLTLKAYEVHRKFKTNASEFYRLIRLREYLPLVEFETHVNEFMQKKHKPSDSVGVVFSGVLPEPMDIFRLVEESGGVVIDDDFASLRRRIYPLGESDDPFERMAQRILNAPPDAMKGSPFKDREKFLLDIVRNSSAQGVVFYNVKFCEPEKFYHPILKDSLKNAGIRSIVVEVDINEPLPQQVKTRIRAFIETLKRG